MSEKSFTPKSPKQMNLYEKLAMIGENVKVLKKDKSGFNFTYVAEEDILARIQGSMQQYHVSLIPGIMPGTVEYIPRDSTKTQVLKTGERIQTPIFEQIVSGTITFTWVNNTNPEEKLEIPWHFIGQQADASQAYGSALTYASRYFLLRFFNIATTNDPDALRAKQRAEEAKKEREVLDDLINQIGSVIEKAIADDEENKKVIPQIVEKTIGDRNYKKVKSAVEAALLLEELNKAFKEETK